MSSGVFIFDDALLGCRYEQIAKKMILVVIPHVNPALSGF